MHPLPRLIATLSLVVLAAGCDGVSKTYPGQHPDLADRVAEAGKRFPEARKRKIVLLGMDSCDPELVDDLIRRGKLPNFARLRREGARGALRSIQPLLSPVIWTTVATGMVPERHGIFDFVTVQGDERVPVSSRMRQADTMWELLSRQGVDVGVVGWLVSYPAEPLPHGFIITDRIGVPAFEYGKERAGLDTPDLTYPPELAKVVEADLVDIDDITLSHVRPFADVSEDVFAQSYERKFTPTNLLGNLRLTLADAETFRRIGTRMLKERKPRFFACYFEAMDALSHFFMRYAPPRMQDVDQKKYRRFKTAIEANYVWHDRVLGEFMDQCDEDTTLLLVSDHGFKSGNFRRNDPSDFHATTGAMWHRKFGVIFAWGNGVARGLRVDGATVHDIAPTVLAAMGYPVPKDMPGKVLTELFEEGLEYVEVPTYYGEARREKIAAANLEGGELGLPNAAQQEQLEQMISLGYIGGDRSDPASTQLTRGQRLLSQGKARQAHEIFLAAHKTRASPRTHFALVRTFTAMGEFDKAKEHLNQGIEMVRRMNGPLNESMMLRTHLHIAMRDLGNAEISARQARDADPFVPDVHVVLAQVLLARLHEEKKANNIGKARQYHDEAKQALEKAISLEPRQFYALKELARLRLAGTPGAKVPMERRRIAIEEAMEELKRALELVPKAPDATTNYAITLLRLGQVHKESGRPREAKEWNLKSLAVLEEATTLYPRRAIGWANKAYTLWMLERLDEAFEAATKTRELDPAYLFNAGLLQALRTHGKPLPAPKPPEPETPPEPGDPKSPRPATD